MDMRQSMTDHSSNVCAATQRRALRPFLRRALRTRLRAGGGSSLGTTICATAPTVPTGPKEPVSRGSPTSPDSPPSSCDTTRRSDPNAPPAAAILEAACLADINLQPPTPAVATPATILVRTTVVTAARSLLRPLGSAATWIRRRRVAVTDVCVVVGGARVVMIPARGSHIGGGTAEV